MKRSKMMELGVGLFMLAGILGLVFLGLRVSGLTLQAPGDTFRLEANFANIGGLKPRARVTMAGVTVGRVSAIELDTDWYDARVILELDGDLEGRLSRDTPRRSSPPACSASSTSGSPWGATRKPWRRVTPSATPSRPSCWKNSSSSSCPIWSAIDAPARRSGLLQGV